METSEQSGNRRTHWIISFALVASIMLILGLGWEASGPIGNLLGFIFICYLLLNMKETQTTLRLWLAVCGIVSLLVGIAHVSLRPDLSPLNLYSAVTGIGFGAAFCYAALRWQHLVAQSPRLIKTLIVFSSAAYALSLLLHWGIPDAILPCTGVFAVTWYLIKSVERLRSEEGGSCAERRTTTNRRASDWGIIVAAVFWGLFAGLLIPLVILGSFAKFCAMTDKDVGFCGLGYWFASSDVWVYIAGALISALTVLIAAHLAKHTRAPNSRRIPVKAFSVVGIVELIYLFTFPIPFGAVSEAATLAISMFGTGLILCAFVYYRASQNELAGDQRAEKHLP